MWGTAGVRCWGIAECWSRSSCGGWCFGERGSPRTVHALDRVIPGTGMAPRQRRRLAVRVLVEEVAAEIAPALARRVEDPGSLFWPVPTEGRSDADPDDVAARKGQVR